MASMNNLHILLMVSFVIFLTSISQAQNGDGNYRLRVLLYDTVDQRLPDYIFDDNEGWLYGFVNLNNYDFADKTARIVIEKGPYYRQGDKITLYDAVNVNSGDPSEEAISLLPGDYDLNDFNWADRAAGLEFPR
jgi:hypothetical protein